MYTQLLRVGYGVWGAIRWAALCVPLVAACQGGTLSPATTNRGTSSPTTGEGAAPISVSAGNDRVQAAIDHNVVFADWGIAGNFSAIPLSALLAKHVSLSGYTQAFVQAAAQAKPVLPPQLLVAICLQESSGGQNVGSYGGPFQFTDDSAWAQFGPQGGDRNTMADGAIGAANYIAYLLQQNGQDLQAALRSYNGPIGQGGLPSYQKDIQAWMQGVMVYGEGV